MPVPFFVRPKPEPLITPPSVSVPVPPTVVAPAIVIGPLYCAVAVPVIAPTPLAPVPCIDTEPSVFSVTLLMSRVPPLITSKDAAFSAPPFVTLNVSALTVVVPVYVFAALSVTVPTPVLFAPAVPPRIALTAPDCRANAVPEVSVPPLPLMFPAVVSDTAFTASLLAPMSSVPPETVTVAPLFIWFAACSTAAPPVGTVRLPAIASTPRVLFRLSVPALTVVRPEYVFALAPDSVSVPTPLFVSPPVPLSTPDAAMLPTALKIASAPPLSIAPERLSVPAAEPIVPAAPSVITPANVLVPAILSSAPARLLPASPLPLIATASAVA